MQNLALDNYRLVVGLEVHVQLSTSSKAFCSDAVVFGEAENTHVSPVSLAYPGTLPRLNEKQLEYAVRLGLALGCTINRESYFDRKNYFYADLPKGYQTTQDVRPICVGGALQINEERTIRIHHIHMEEDAGKSNHELDDTYSLVDLNRAGTPLLEIVTEPDFRSAEEVEAFMYQMRQLVRYLEISDGNMEQGSMRCDCNVSVNLKSEDTYGERCEIKNVNSMKFAKQAINYEFRRQVKILESGGTITRNTLNFNPETGVTTPLRSKEDAHDYRYFPDLDQQPVFISKKYVEQVREALPYLPRQLREKFMSTGLSEYHANLLVEEKAAAYFFLGLMEAQPTLAAMLSNFMINKILPWAKQEQKSVAHFPLSKESCIAFVQLIHQKKVNNSTAYQVLFPALLENPSQDPTDAAKDLDLIQAQDDSFMETIVENILIENPEEVKKYRGGKKALVGFFMGELMRKSKGKVDPKAAQKLLLNQLNQQ